MCGKEHHNVDEELNLHSKEIEQINQITKILNANSRARTISNGKGNGVLFQSFGSFFTPSDKMEFALKLTYIS
jgi:hypothetical protein